MFNHSFRVFIVDWENELNTEGLSSAMSENWISTDPTHFTLSFGQTKTANSRAAFSVDVYTCEFLQSNPNLGGPKLPIPLFTWSLSKMIRCIYIHQMLNVNN